jgi:hypothetical protein
MELINDEILESFYPLSNKYIYLHTGNNLI